MLRRFAIPFFALALFLMPLVAHAQTEFQHGDEVVLLADSITVYAYPDTSSTVVGVHYTGYNSLLGSQIDAPDGWYFLAGDVGYIQAAPDALALVSDVNYDELRDDTCSGIDDTTTDPIAFFRCAYVYMETQAYPSAVEVLTQAIERNPDNAEAYALRGWAYRRSNQVDNAIADYTHAIDLGDQSARTYIGLANTYTNIPDYVTGAQWILTALDRYPDAYHALNILIICMRNLGAYDQAEDAYQRALAVNPYGTFAYLNYGKLFENDHDYERAIEEYKKAIDAEPYDAVAYTYIAYIYAFRYGDADTAIDQLEAGLAVNPEDDLIYINLGNVYAYELGDTQAAIDNFAYALELDPYNIGTYYDLAVLYARSGDYEKGLKYILATDAYEPRESRYYIFRAQMHFGLGEYKLAMDYADMFLGTTSDVHYVVWGSIIKAIAALQAEDYMTAIVGINNAFVAEREFTTNWTESRGWRVYDQRSALAQEYYMATLNEPDVADNYLQLANILVEFGGWNEALSYYRQYLTLVDNPDVQAFVDMLASYVE